MLANAQPRTLCPCPGPTQGREQAARARAAEQRREWAERQAAVAANKARCADNAPCTSVDHDSADADVVLVQQGRGGRARKEWSPPRVPEQQQQQQQQQQRQRGGRHVAGDRRRESREEGAGNGQPGELSAEQR